MSKTGFALTIVVVVAAIMYLLTEDGDSPSVQSNKAEQNPTTTPNRTEIDSSSITPPSKEPIDKNFDVAGVHLDTKTFSIDLDGAKNWNFSIIGSQSHPNGDYSYSGKNELGVVALVTQGERRMYATVIDGNQLIEISADGSGELIEWKVIDPRDVPLENDFVVQDFSSVPDG